jgi:hypothetical protein
MRKQAYKIDNISELIRPKINYIFPILLTLLRYLVGSPACNGTESWIRSNKGNFISAEERFMWGSLS